MLRKELINILTICFTGHRPDKLGGYDWNTDKNQRIMKTLRTRIIELINSTEPQVNHFKFICGGALGIDQMAFEICKELRDSALKLNPCRIELELAIPFYKQASKWFNKKDVERFNSQKLRADIVTLIDTMEGYKFDKVSIGDYHPAKMQLRNQYMVDNSEIVIAMWNGSKGGTANCVNYAKKLGKEIIVINPDTL